MTTGLAHSVQVRLVQHAKKLRIDPNVVLVRYACERLLFRLSQSPHADRFLLKGALLLLVWLGETIRPTRDAASGACSRDRRDRAIRHAGTARHRSWRELHAELAARRPVVGPGDCRRG